MLNIAVSEYYIFVFRLQLSSFHVHFQPERSLVLRSLAVYPYLMSCLLPNTSEMAQLWGRPRGNVHAVSHWPHIVRVTNFR